MSHPVFLNATSYPRMPDGSSREWEAFFLEGGPELEANAHIPILWMALFTPMDLRWARLIDDEDLDSDAREDMMDYGDTQYPYLVTSLERALATLAQRAPLLVARFGADVAPIVDNFARHLRLHYGPYVLCRTSGLPDVEDFGPELQKALDDFDAWTRTGDAGSDNVIVANINDTRALLRPDRMRLLTGSGHDFTRAEPEPEVIEVALPVDAEVAAPARVMTATTAQADGATRHVAARAVAGSSAGASAAARAVAGSSAGASAAAIADSSTGASATAVDSSSAGASAGSSAAASARAPAGTLQSDPPARPGNTLLGWIVAIAVGVPTVVVYQATGSVWISGILFLLLCAAAGVFMKRRAGASKGQA